MLLPEKIDVLPADDAEARKTHLAQAGRARTKVWLVAGVGVDNGKERRNEAWWFAPDGKLATNYLKHFMAPPEREFVSGSEFPVNADRRRELRRRHLQGHALREPRTRIRRARCRGHAGAGVGFHDDAWMAANMTKLRGVENGYAVVRSSRDGLLSVSDAYGRMLAVAESTAFPGTSLLATVNVGPRVPTIYTRIGDVLGWLCVAGGAVLLVAAVIRRGNGPDRHAPG